MNLTYRILKSCITSNFSIITRQMQSNKCPLLSADSPLIFRQLFELSSSTYTYLIGDAISREAILIDPVFETAQRDATLVSELGLKLLYVINTHLHADHVTGTGKLKQLVDSCQSAISMKSGGHADHYFSDNDILRCGAIELECRSTPGHTLGCTTFVLHAAGAAFTGDTLLIRGCGRTDFQNGSAESLYDSVHARIFSLPDSYLLFPGHDYTGRMVTSVAEEKKFNSRLTKTKAEFVDIMNNLNLPRPKKMDMAVPLNIVCGIQS